MKAFTVNSFNIDDYEKNPVDKAFDYADQQLECFKGYQNSTSSEELQLHRISRTTNSSNLIRIHSTTQQNFLYPDCHSSNLNVNCKHLIKTHDIMLHYSETLRRNDTKVIELVLTNIVSICHNSISLMIILLFLIPHLENQHVSVLIN